MIRGAIRGLAVLAVLTGTLAGLAQARTPSRTVILHPRLAKLPYDTLSAPHVSGDEALFTLSGEHYGQYALRDDRTGQSTTITPPQGCELWTPGAVLGGPWVLFECLQGPRLYDIPTRAWDIFPCGSPCADVGVAAPTALGGDWVAINETGDCDPRYFSCAGDLSYVRLPSGTSQDFTPTATTVADLDSARLAQRLCRPLRVPAEGTLTLDGGFAVLQDEDGAFLERCGTTRRIKLAGLAAGRTLPLVGVTPDLVLACGSSPGQYVGIFLPSLRHLTFTLPAAFGTCDAELSARSLYVTREQGAYWAAAMPTRP